jgi:4-phytase/acid phosphatase
MLKAIGPGGIETPASRASLARLQAILAPRACDGGAGTCFAGEDTIVDGPAGPRAQGPLFTAAGLAEDLLLEYAEGMPSTDVGWGRAESEAQIASVMGVHERMFGLLRRNSYLSARLGAPMARLILAALAGQAGPHSGPKVRLLALAGHDTNLVLMASVFALEWTLPGEPDISAPATTLAFELWSDKGALYVRPVIYYETLEQLRTLQPRRARKLALTFADCASGPMGSCPLPTLQRRAQALIPPGCGAG